VFGINYRQTRELGEFLKDLHRGLFGEVPGWAASDKTTGALPRVGTIRSFKDLSRAVAAEARRWRDEIPNATVAVLYDGKMEPKRRQWLRRQLEEALSDTLTTVDAVSPASGETPLRRTDRVVIASVKQTKGLEFDAVVFIETKPRWSRPAIEVDVRARNGLYVAASRARAGLSLCMVNLPSCVEEVLENGRCERAEWPEDL
jgi:superfamily I DNA/RNA helicase